MFSTFQSYHFYFSIPKIDCRIAGHDCSLIGRLPLSFSNLKADECLKPGSTHAGDIFATSREKNKLEKPDLLLAGGCRRLGDDRCMYSIVKLAPTD